MYPALPSRYLPVMYQVRTAKMYERVKPYEDALEMVELLQMMGVKMVVVSSDQIELAVAKRQLLKQYYPMLQDRLVIASRKRYAVPNVYLVDDYPNSDADWFPVRTYNTSYRNRARYIIYKRLPHSSG